MCELKVLPLILCSFVFKLTDCTTSYDQRQTGDLNVQIGLSNIKLIAVLNSGKEDYQDYDYAYDYSEMTIKPTKPHSGTTPKPSTSHHNGTTLATSFSINDTISNNFTSPALLVHVTEHNVTDVTEFSNNKTEFTPTDSGINLFPTTNKNVDTYQAAVGNGTAEGYTETVSDIADTHTSTLSDSQNNMSTTQTVTTSQCRRGFVPNQQGKCVYQVHGTTNALRRLVKLAQKIKIGRDVKETE